jgi:hypothetical protein
MQSPLVADFDGAHLLKIRIDRPLAVVAPDNAHALIPSLNEVDTVLE